jgi:tetratricopeptide (TPR) repeat protein
LAYLVVSGQSYRRSTLAGLFCQEAAVPARTLRVLLSRIRRQLRSELILTEEDTVRFNRAAAWVDFLEFTPVLEGNLSRQSLPHLETAIALYRGEFLEGISLLDSAEFEIWLLGQRAQMRRLYERGLGEIVSRLLAQESYEAAIGQVQQLLQSNPLLEEAHAQLIWLYNQTGQPDAALAQYELCRELLWRELAVEPSPELKSLSLALASGRPVAPFRITPIRIMPRAQDTTALPESADIISPDFVGRDTELEQLQQAWQSTLAGQGGVILVAAVAGGGKTRLVQEFGQRLPPGSFLAARCYESTTALPYHPWPDILEMCLSALDSPGLTQLSPFTQEYLARLVPNPGQRPGRRFPATAPDSEPAGHELEAIFTAVRQLLASPAGPGEPTLPLLVFIDDLQWAGETSLLLFHFIARRANQARLLLVGSYRSEELEDTPVLQTLLNDLQHSSVGRLRLNSLTPAAVNLLVRQLWPRLPEGYRPHITVMLAHATGGNPLFVTELIRELSSTTLVPAELPVPATIQELIQRRLGRLLHNGRQIIEALAVLHQAATLTELQQISARSEDEVALTIDWALRRGLLQVQPDTRPVRYEFLHELIKEAVAKQLSQARRELLHRRVARALEQAGAKAATLAYHWGMVGDAAKEGEYAAQAGEHAALLYAHDEAVRYFRRALELLSQSTRRVQVMGHLGDLWLLTGQWSEAETIYREALALTEKLPARRLRAECQASLGRLLELQGHYPQALMWLEQAQTLSLASKDKQGLAHYTGNMGRVYWRQGEYQAALDYCHQALTLSRELDDKTGIASLINNLGLIHWHQEKYDKALAYFEEAGQIYRTLNDKLGLATCLGNTGNIYKDQEQYDKALVYYREALQIDQALGNKMGTARHTGNMGIVYYNLAAYEEALTSFEQALAIDQELGHQEGIARHLGNIGNIYWQWRQYDQTLLYYQRALQMDHEAGSQRGVALHLGNIGVIYSRCGAYEWASACLVQALAVDYGLGNKLGAARHLGNIAELYREQGAYPDALACCDRAIALLQHLHNQFHLSWHCMIKAKILAAMGEYTAALSWNEDGRRAAAAVKRQDALFATELMAVSLAVTVKQIDMAAADQKLAALLPIWMAGEEQAAIHYEIWRLYKGQEEVRERAADLYHTLSMQTPDITYRRRYQELTSQTLPKPSPLPPLPAFVTTPPAALDALLTQVDQLIASL